MDIGLYNLKHAVRRMIGDVLPLCRNISPNAISWSLLPVGALTAIVYHQATNGHPALYAVGVLLIFVRMFLGTLDGLVAEHYWRSTPVGEMLNRLTPELCDVMFLGALTLARPEWAVIGLAAVAVSWLVTFSGLLGATVGNPVQSVGPAGQTDRLAALQLFSLLALLGHALGWSVDFIGLFLGYVVLGGVVTVILRLVRNWQRSARAARS
jgi:phosphatidylglycerophosphate synthase